MDTEIISGFSMPTACSQIKLTEDNHYAFVSGSYGPQVKCFEFAEISEKFLRGMKSLSKKMEILSEDCSKFCILSEENYVEFHTGRSMYQNIKLNSLARDMNVSKEYAELYFPSQNGKVNRINLELGRFFKPFDAGDKDLFCGDVNSYHSLYACGSGTGEVLFFDPRTQNSVGSIQISDSKIPKGAYPTSLKFKNAFCLGVGTSSGHVLVHDLRSKQPITTKDHYYRFPINDIQFINSDYVKNAVMSSDKKSIKLWRDDNGKPITSIESKDAINNAVVLPNSGLIFAACQSPEVKTFFIPKIGPAPSWCSFLDDVINDIESNPQPLDEHDDKKFITLDDLKTLHLNHLMGTGVLKAYMHGYLMPLDVYRRAVDQKASIEDSDNLVTLEGFYRSKAESYLNKLTASKIRIENEQSAPAVNKSLFMKANASKKDLKVLKDPRFAALFEDEEFEIDQEDENFVLNSAVMSNRHEQGEKYDSSDDEDIREYRKEIRQNLHKIRNKEHIAQIEEDKNAVIDIKPTQGIVDGGKTKKVNPSSSKKLKFASKDDQEKSRTIGDQLNKPEAEQDKGQAKNKASSKPTGNAMKKKKIVEQHMKERKSSMRQFNPRKRR